MQERAPEQFLHQVQRDPLFAAEGMDLEGAAKALAALAVESLELEKAFGSLSLLHRLFLIRHPIAAYVFPIPFLRAFVESEKMRREFLSQPSNENARRLIAQWRCTQIALRVSVRKYIRLHHLLFFIEGKDGSFVYKDLLGNVTELGAVNKTLTLLKENAAMLAREVDYYEALLLSKVQPREVHDEPPLRFETLSDGDISSEHRQLHALEVQDGFVFRHGKTLEKHGPLRYSLALTVGAEKEPHVFYAHIIKERTSGLPVLRVSFADHFRFLPIAGPQAHFGSIGRAVFETLIERGIRYFYQSTSNLYVSRDSGYWADIATIVDSRRRSDLDMRLVWKQKSSMLDLILGMAVVETHTFLAHTRERIARGAIGSFSALYGVLIRSYPGLFYLSFNGSVWRLGELPNLLGSYYSKPEDLVYVDEKTVLADTTPEELALIMKGGRIREEERLKAEAGE